MKMVPTFKCRNMKEAIRFYTGVLDFKLKDPGSSAEDWVVDLVNADMEMTLTTMESDSLFGSIVYIRVDHVDDLFAYYRKRGLKVPENDQSPVHQGPLDQSWGMREFYVTDVDGNTLRFGQPFEMPKANYLNAFPYVEGRRLDLPVKDVKTAVSFYTGVMNFRELSREEEPVPKVVLARDQVQIAIAENGGDPTQEGCFFEVDHVENALKELQLNGLKKEVGEIGLEKHGETVWRIFYLLAPDGLCYCMGQKQAE